MRSIIKNRPDEQTIIPRQGGVREPRTSTGKKNRIHFLLAILTLPVVEAANAQFSFVPGNDYSSSPGSSAITEYTPDGAVIGSLHVPGTSSVQGLAFGPDGLLYATTDQGSGFSVFAMNSAGTVEQSYPGAVYVEGNLAFGQLAVNSQYLYIGGQDNLTRYSIGQPNSGTVIYQNNQIFGLALAPNGNIFVGSAYQIEEITPAGAVLETVPGAFTDLRGIAYDPASNSLFVTELGSTGSFWQLLRLNATTGAVEARTSFYYGMAVSLTPSGDLLVGSWTTSPGIFDENLNQIGTLQNGPQIFVTVDPVPEPSEELLMVSGGLFFTARRFFTWRIKSRKL
jgi:hypothetical protein